MNAVDQDIIKALRRLLDGGKPVLSKPTAEQLTPQNKSLLLSAIAAAGDAVGTEVNLGGYVLRMSSSSHASAKLEVAFDRQPTRTENWHPIGPSGKLRRPDGGRFESFRVRKQSGTPSTSNTVRFVVDTSGDGLSVEESPQNGAITNAGKMQVRVGIVDDAGNEVDAIGSSQGAVAVAGWDGSTYTRMLVDTGGRQVVVGAAASGALKVGNPVLVSGYDGVLNTYAIGVDSSGTVYTYACGFDTNAGSRQISSVVINAGVHGVGATALLVGGSDGTNARLLKTDTSGRQIAVGASASGSAVAGSPVLMGGSDGTNARTVETYLGSVADASANYHVAVKNLPAWIGTQANAWNAAATGAGGTSTALDTFGCRRVDAFGNSSGATTISTQVSQDNSNWYDATATTGANGNSVVLAGAGNFGISFDTGARYVRLKSSANVTVTATLAVKG